MKSGAGDPFADDESDAEAEETDDQAAADVEAGPEPKSESMDATTETETESEPETQQESTTSRERDDFPLTLRRDNVKDERPNVHQLFVQDSTEKEAKSAERELEDRLGEDIYRLDAREAIYLAGMRNLDDAEGILREWGYDL